MTTAVDLLRTRRPSATGLLGAALVSMLLAGCARESGIGLHAALTPTWSETAIFADYVLPMGLAPERHDLQSRLVFRRHAQILCSATPRQPRRVPARA